MPIHAPDESCPENGKMSPEMAQKTDGKDVVLIPQPSDDPEDPLVSKEKKGIPFP